MSSASSRWLRSRSPSALTTRRRLLLFIAVAVLVLISPAFVGDIFDGARFQDRWIELCSEHWIEMSRRTLPPMPASAQKLARNLFAFLNPNATQKKTCNRMIRLGGQVVDRAPALPVVSGEHVGCVDPEFLLSHRDCLVYSFSSCSDRSFQQAVKRLGCQVLSFPSCHKKDANNDEHDQLQEYMSALKHSQRIISFVALSPSSNQTQTMLEYLADRVKSTVQQLGFVLDLNEAVAHTRLTGSWIDINFSIKLYQHILDLQGANFYMFDVEALETLDSVPVTVLGGQKMQSILRTSWIKTACT